MFHLNINIPSLYNVCCFPLLNEKAVFLPVAKKKFNTRPYTNKERYYKTDYSPGIILLKHLAPASGVLLSLSCQGLSRGLTICC